MSDQDNSTAIAPVELIGDNLVALADSAEKRVSAIKRILTVALSVTNPQDWQDFGGKPYLQASGAEKIARLFGVCWQIEEPSLQTEEDGHFMYTYRGTFTLKSAEIEAIGTRSSKDLFFSEAKGESIPPSEIDKGDVKKSAYTNCIGNGVTRLLGLRNLTWEQVRAGGIDQSKASKVDFKTGALLPNFGEYAKRPVSEVPSDGLTKYAEALTRNIKDPKSAQFKTSNEKILSAITAEMKKREAAGATKAADPLADFKLKIEKFTDKEQMRKFYVEQSTMDGLTDAQRDEMGAMYTVRVKEFAAP